MKILITGGAGFIGSNLTRRLLKEKHVVTVIDDLSTGSMENIKDFKENKHFHFELASILDIDILEKVIKPVDLVFHLAAAVGVEYIINNPLKSIEINVQGTENVLKLSHKYKKKVILASTSEVYGKNGNDTLSENDDRILGSTTISRWSYSNTKALDEFLALAYYHEKKLPVVIFRLFNTTGPGQVGDYGMVVPRFVKQALLEKPLTVYGSGDQTRCFTHIYDVINALLSLMTNEKCLGEIFNIGNPQEVSINALAEAVMRKADSSSQIIRHSYDEVMGKNFEDMKRRVPNIDKIKKFTGWSPTLSLDNIINDVIKYNKETLRF
ncbi:GDP-mannose 4,6-dehydratase [Candidatus Calescamantes bacterium]|nr:GDP-mannose 4,6-dehydratase [Candidatus Calescamantes bacterium]